MRKNAAFTLVEIMIVVSIIALIAVIAVPSFMRARERSQNTKFINALRIATSAFELYAAEHNGAYPAEVKRKVISPEMQPYFGPKFDWTAPTPIGGVWDWDYKKFPSFTAGVSVDAAPVTSERMTDIDATMDDGNLSTGAFQQTNTFRYTGIIE
jgi:prepilin-type N-terminal cleavage/methylation domain-containing protein